MKVVPLLVTRKITPVLQEMTGEKYRKVLAKYIPPTAVDYCFELIKNNKVSLIITEDRKHIFGDYLSTKHLPTKHRITVNYNLNKYAFLITLIHELAHLTSFAKYGAFILPHGLQWKQEFRRLMFPLLHPSVFPEDVLQCLKKHFINPKYSSSADHELVRVVSKYDPPDGMVFVELIEPGQYFVFSGTKYLNKGKKTNRSKYYLVQRLTDGKEFLFSPVARVKPE